MTRSAASVVPLETEWSFAPPARAVARAHAAGIKFGAMVGALHALGHSPEAMLELCLIADGVPLDMRRATRTFTPDQYRAIMLRDGGCRMPGCDAGPEACEAHHSGTYWEDGGLTDLANGLGVCRGSGHHRMVHEGAWTITGNPNGEITFHDPDGNPRGSTRPRNPPKPIPTRAGRDITRAQQRALGVSSRLRSLRKSVAGRI